MRAPCGDAASYKAEEPCLFSLAPFPALEERMVRHRWLLALAAIATAVLLVSGDMAFARAGGGFSGGSRGMRTFSAPSATRTAPTAAP